MATGTRRLRWAFPQNMTSLAAGTRLDLAATTIYQPEATRTIKSVYVDLWCRQIDVAATSMSGAPARRIGIKLGAVAFNDQDINDTVTNTGEHMQLHFRRDITAYWLANFGAGTSQTCQVGFIFGNIITINHVALITVNYEFDTAATTRIKTACFQLESFTGLLTNALVEMGTDQLPQLTAGGVLPEASVVVRDWFIVITGNERVQGGTTDFAMGWQIDSDAEVTEGLRESALASSCHFTSVYSRKGSVPTTSATHKFKARCAAVTSRFQFSARLYVTYEYDHAASTQILQSLEIPVSPANNDVITWAATTSADKHTFEKELFIEEPGTPVLVHSGLEIQIESNSGVNNLSFVANVGGGAERTYTVVKINEVSCGTHATIGHRFDAGSAGGAGLTLARGRNALSCQFYWTTAFAGSEIPEGCHIVAYLNYVSDKHADGDHVHNHTIEVLVQETKAAAVSFDDTIAVNIPEAAYFVNAFGIRTYVLVNGENLYIAWGAKYDALEGPGFGWQSLRGNVHNCSSEIGIVHLAVDCSHLAKRWASDPDSRRMDLEVSRTYRFTSIAAGTGNFVCAALLVTYHSIGWTQTFFDRRYSTGDGSGFEMTLHRDDTDELLLRGTTTPGGGCTFTWMDDTIKVYAQSAQGSQPNQYRGRSAAKIMSAA